MLHVRKAIYLFCVYCTNLMSGPYFPLSAMTPGSSCLERLVSNFSSWLTCTNIAAAPLTIGHLLVYEINVVVGYFALFVFFGPTFWIIKKQLRNNLILYKIFKNNNLILAPVNYSQHIWRLDFIGTFTQSSLLNIMILIHIVSKAGGEGGTAIYGLYRYRVCAAVKGMVFKQFNLGQGI